MAAWTSSVGRSNFDVLLPDLTHYPRQRRSVGWNAGTCKGAQEAHSAVASRQVSASIERPDYFLDYDVSQDRVCSIGSPHEPVGFSSTLAPRSASSGRAPSSRSTSSSGYWTKARDLAAGSSREPAAPSTTFAATSSVASLAARKSLSPTKSRSALPASVRYSTRPKKPIGCCTMP